MSSVELLSKYILAELQAKQTKPLFVALRGAQGSGKSYLSARLCENLTSPPNALRVAVLSLDDIYLTHEELVSLANCHPDNRLWRGRGQPGTHDVGLGLRILSALRDGKLAVELPRYDKSLFEGEGDRLRMDGTGIVIEQPPPPDIVVMEGWCMGFSPITPQELSQRWDEIWKQEKQMLELTDDQTCRKTDLEAVNNALKAYKCLWDFFDTFISIKPVLPSGSSNSSSQYSVIYRWRLQQERNMKAQNGGRGMSDEAVKQFVDRYIPGYVFFDNIKQLKKTAKHMAELVIDEERKVVRFEVQHP